VLMVTKSYVDKQLRGLGLSVSMWSKSTINQLPKIMVRDENILGIVNGRYEGGFATLCATDKRILLIDNKPLFFKYNDIRYEKVSEADYDYRLVTGFLTLRTFGQTINFRTWSQKSLHKMAGLIQDKLFEVQQSSTAVTQDKKQVEKVMAKAAEDIEKKIQSFAPQEVTDSADISDKPSSRRAEFIQQAASRANKIGKFALD